MAYKNVLAPLIVSIEPSVIPIDGADLVIRGNFFDTNAKVFVGGGEIDSIFIDSGTIYCHVNGNPLSNNVFLFIRNPDADSDSISLFYADQSNSNVNSSIEENALDNRDGLPTPTSFDPSILFPTKSTLTKYKKNNYYTDSPKDEDIEDIIQLTQLDRDIYKECEPSISTITPILSPTSGTNITITGYHFAKHVRVTIGNVTTTEKTIYSLNGEKIECTIHCDTPKLSEGNYSVSVSNSKGLSSTMENILIYLPFKKWQELTSPSPTAGRKASRWF